MSRIDVAQLTCSAARPRVLISRLRGGTSRPLVSGRDRPGPGRRNRDMNTMQQAPPAEPGAVPDAQDMSAAVEEQMGKIVTELGPALGGLLTSLGTRSGLWAVLAGAGPLTTAEVAAKVSVEPSLVREWLRAQAAGGDP